MRHSTALDDDTRWSVVERLLHDDGVDLTDRVAGCLVLLYGQQLSLIVAITRDQLVITDDVARLHLGATHIEVPDPLRGLLSRLASEGRRYTGVGSPPVAPWLFPGLSPGRPLSAARVGERLRRLGIPTMAGLRAALMHLGARLPAAVLADLLGIAPTTAVRWVRAAGGDWTTYAGGLLDTVRTSLVTSFRSGVAIEVVARLLTHSSSTTTSQIYVHLDVADIRAALQRAGVWNAPVVAS